MSKPVTNSATSQGISIDGEDFAKAAAALDDAGFTAIAEKVVKHALRQSANVVRDNVKARARRHHRKGRLEKGVHTTWKGAGLAFQLRVSATGPEAHLIAGGVRPHRIVSTRPMTIGGVHPFARAVMSPGFRADPFVHKGIQDSLPAIQAIVDAAAKDMADQLAAAVRS